MIKNKKSKVVPKSEKKTGRLNFTQIALDYRRNESKILAEKVRKMGYPRIKKQVENVED